MPEHDKSCARARPARKVLSLLVMLLCAADLRAAAQSDWTSYGGDAGGTRRSGLRQIDRGNVARLEVAWTYHTGDAGKNTNIECTPVVVEGRMYLTTADLGIVALDAATGAELWRFRAFEPGRRSAYPDVGPAPTRGLNRGVAYWSDGKPSGARRILVGTTDGRLISLDARDGRPDPAFGAAGAVDLRDGYRRDLSRVFYGVTSAPGVYENTVILGVSGPDGQEAGAPGDVRAFDVRTGREVWRFRTVPQPGDFGHEMWAGDSWKDRGGANPWSGVTIDRRRGIVFAATGSANFDFYGGDRPGDNLFANCVLALDARTGRRLWHYQIVRHDLWDYDLPTPPNLVTVTHKGKRTDAVAQVTKTGYVFLLDRLTGEPLFPVVERAVAASDIPGESAARAQPFPVRPAPFVRQGFTEADITDISPEAHAAVLARFRRLRAGAIFTPPSMQGTIQMPGFHGGATWSGASFDPATATLYVNANNIPWVNTIVEAAPGSPVRFTHTGYRRFLDAEGYPAVKPPWGVLTAIDLNRGAIRWQVPLGEYPELRARGLAPTGTENFGGSIVTAGGLLFIGATRDERFRAFDLRTGEVLWEHALPAGGYATPCTYSAGGRQYVVIAAGGGGKLGTKTGDAFVAFALPRRDGRDPNHATASPKRTSEASARSSPQGGRANRIFSFVSGTRHTAMRNS